MESEGRLAGWLYRAVRYCSANALRLDRIRQRHEREAAMEREGVSERMAGWTEVEMELEGAVDRLSEKDRQAIVLRFYRAMGLREVGEAMGIGEDAARMRVDRAVERLRGMLEKQGITAGTTGLGVVMAEGVTEAVQAGVVERAIAAVNGGGVGTAGLIAKGAGKMMVLAKVKVAAGILIGGAVFGTLCLAGGEQSPASHSPAAASQSARIPASLSADALLDRWEQIYGRLDLIRCQESSTEHVLSRSGLANQNGRLFPSTWRHAERISDGPRYHYRWSTSEKPFAEIQSIHDSAFDGKVMMGYIGSDGKGVIGTRKLNHDQPGAMMGLLGPQLMIPRRDFTPPSSATTAPAAGAKPSPSFPRVSFLSAFRDADGAVHKDVRVRPMLENVAGEPCHVVEVKYAPRISPFAKNVPETASVTLWLAASKDSLLMKYEATCGDVAYASISIEEVSHIATANVDFWYPAKGTVWRQMPGATTPASSEITVHAFNPLPALQDSDFVVKFPRGIVVYDEINGEVYAAGEGK